MLNYRVSGSVAKQFLAKLRKDAIRQGETEWYTYTFALDDYDPDSEDYKDAIKTLKSYTTEKIVKDVEEAVTHASVLNVRYPLTAQEREAVTQYADKAVRKIQAILTNL